MLKHDTALELQAGAHNIHSSLGGSQVPVMVQAQVRAVSFSFALNGVSYLRANPLHALPRLGGLHCSVPAGGMAVMGVCQFANSQVGRAGRQASWRAAPMRLGGACRSGRGLGGPQQMPHRGRDSGICQRWRRGIYAIRMWARLLPCTHTAAKALLEA